MVGTLDVDGMLASIPAGLFEEWCEFDRLEPISPHKQTEVIAEFAAAAMTHWGWTLENNQPLTKEHLMPWLKLTEKPKKKAGYVTPEEAQRQRRERSGRRS